MVEHFEKQVAQETLPNKRAEQLAEWIGLAVGGLLAAGVWLGGSSERDGLKLVTELGVCAFFGFLAYLVVLGIGRFLVEGRPFLARTLHSSV